MQHNLNTFEEAHKCYLSITFALFKLRSHLCKFTNLSALQNSSCIAYSTVTSNYMNTIKYYKPSLPIYKLLCLVEFILHGIFYAYFQLHVYHSKFQAVCANLQTFVPCRIVPALHIPWLLPITFGLFNITSCLCKFTNLCALQNCSCIAYSMVTSNYIWTIQYYKPSVQIYKLLRLVELFLHCLFHGNLQAVCTNLQTLECLVEPVLHCIFHSKFQLHVCYSNLQGICTNLQACVPCRIGAALHIPQLLPITCVLFNITSCL